MKRYIFAIAVWLLVGCGMTLEPMKHYALNVTAPSKHSIKYPKTLQISMPRFLKRQNSTKIYYSYSLNETNTYLNSSWSNNLSKMLYATVYEYIDSLGIYKNVVGYDSSVYGDVSLDMTVYDISHHLQKHTSKAILDIKVSLIDNQTQNIIKSKRFRYEQSTKSVNAKGFVDAENILVDRFLRDLARFLG